MPTINYDYTQNAGFTQTYNQIMAEQESQNSGGNGKDKALPLSGKKIVTHGGSSELQFGLINTSFKTIFNDMMLFRKVVRDDSPISGNAADRLFYALDQPGHYYFKLLFYFSNPYSDPTNPMSSNLLGINYRDEDGNKVDTTEGAEINTALNYLYNNMEYTRFNRLAQFIQLLSDISTKSPWYFQSISGLDQAIERPEIDDFKVEPERKQITIKCLADAYDNRIGRLLDLYRSVVYSQNLHKWILPQNLRKFDMGIYIFNSPIKTISGGRFGISNKSSDRVLETTFKEYYGEESEDSGNYSDQIYINPGERDIEFGGSKYIELRGCEIDYNSSKSVYSELDNAEGKSMEYEIIIKFDSAVEDRYDPIFNNYIGDFVTEDLFAGVNEVLNQSGPYSGVNNGGGNTEFISATRGEAFGARPTLLDSAVGMGLGYINTVVNKVLIGNIYGFSLGRIEDILNSDPMSAVMKTGREVSNASLIAKRISDFTDPDKGTRELSGKNLYDTQPTRNGWRITRVPTGRKSLRDPENDHQDVDNDLTGKSLRSPETDHQGVDSDLTDKSLRSPDTDHQDVESDLEGKSLRSPETDHQDTDSDLDGKSFRNPETDHQDTDSDLDGKSLRSPETDHQDVDNDLTGMNFYRP